jgi:hypothetical protein
MAVCSASALLLMTLSGLVPTARPLRREATSRLRRRLSWGIALGSWAYAYCLLSQGDLGLSGRDESHPELMNPAPTWPRPPSASSTPTLPNAPSLGTVPPTCSPGDWLGRPACGVLLSSAYENSVSALVKTLYTTNMTEERLPGGYSTGAVLIGDVIHKPAAPWTPTVHALLRHLEDAGFDGAPRALGFDDQGREMLTYLPGDTVGDRTPWPAWVQSDSTLIQVGRWLRRLHDTTVSFVPPPDERWFIGGTVQPGLIVGHQDAAPYNAVVDGDRLVGFCDWDIAAPSSREFDLALSALWWVPLGPPSTVEPLGFHDFDGRSRRLHLLLDAYGYGADRQGLSAVIVQRARRQATAIRQIADSGDPAGTRLLFVAEYFESAVSDIEELPNEFWAH